MPAMTTAFSTLRARATGTRWHRWAALALLLALPPTPAEAQDAGEGPTDAPSVDAPSVDAPSVDGPESAGADELDSLPEEAPPSVELAPPSAELAPPSAETPPSTAPPAPPRAPAASPPVPEEARARYWRMPRETVLRPLTLPQGVARFDSTVSVSTLGARTFASGFFGLAVGVLDDLEIGATPFGITFIPPFTIADPVVYVRARLLSGDVQIALRSEVFIPIGQLEAQWGLTAELAWTATTWFRLDAALDYSLLFSDPLNQRVGVPVTATFQVGPNALGVGTGVYVFNDFDDVDVPLLVSWTVALRGFQGPLGEAKIEGGFTDLEAAESAWLIRGKLTFFAYF